MGSAIFPFPMVFRSPAQVPRASSGLPGGLALGNLPGLFDGQRRGLDLEKPQLLGFRGQARSVSTPHPSPSCWTLCASRGPPTAPSPGLYAALLSAAFNGSLNRASGQRLEPPGLGKAEQGDPAAFQGGCSGHEP